MRDKAVLIAAAAHRMATSKGATLLSNACTARLATWPLTMATMEFAYTCNAS